MGFLNSALKAESNADLTPLENEHGRAIRHPEKARKESQFWLTRADPVDDSL